MKVKVQPKQGGEGKGKMVIKTSGPLKGRRSRHIVKK